MNMHVLSDASLAGKTPPDEWITTELILMDPQTVATYERSLYSSFFPILERNPLIRDLWIWDDSNRRLRTKVPYEDQWVVALENQQRREYAISVGINLDPEKHWQSGAYGFARPTPQSRSCEFLIMAHGNAPILHGPTVIRKLVFNFILPELSNKGYRVAYATCADHLLKLYQRIGAVKIDEKIVDGYRRHFLRWDLASAPEQVS